MFSPLAEILKNMRIILATQAKQRGEIFAKTSLPFEQKPSRFEENLKLEEYSFEEYVKETAMEKVKSVYEELKNDKRHPDLIIGLDTMVLCNDKLLGKPSDKKEAIEMITMLTSSNTPHYVLTGFAIYYKGNYSKFVETTKIHMEKLTKEEIVSYVDSGEPMGKAGGYAIQGLAASFIRKIEGDYYNVMGLPLCRLTSELKKIVLVQPQ